MGNVFRKQKASKITSRDKAVLQLRQQRDKLRQYQRRIESSLEKDRELAKLLLAEGKKERALLLLRKKRYLDKQLSNADMQLNNLQQLADDIEFAQIETEVVEGLKVGSEALKEINETMKIDDIAQLLDETKEAYDRQQEINALLSGVLSADDEQLAADELDELLRQEVEARLPDVPSAKDAGVPIDEDLSEASGDDQQLPAAARQRKTKVAAGGAEAAMCEA